MKITFTQAEALVFISQANTENIAHSFVQITKGRNNDEVETHLKWEPEWRGPVLSIFLNRNSTWRAELDMVQSLRPS